MDLQAAARDDETMTLFAGMYLEGHSGVVNKVIAFLLKTLGVNSLMRFTEVDGKPAVRFLDADGRELGQPVLIEQRHMDAAKARKDERKSGVAALILQETTSDLTLAQVQQFVDTMGAMKAARNNVQDSGRLILQRQIPAGAGISDKLLEAWFNTQKIIDAKTKAKASEIGIIVLFEYVSVEGTVDPVRSDAVNEAFRQSAKTMKAGELSQGFLERSVGSGVMVTDPRVTRSGELNLLPDGPIGILAIMVAFADTEGNSVKLFDLQQVERALSGFALGYKNGNLTLLQKVDENPNVDVYRRNGLVIQMIKAIAYNLAVAFHRMMEKAVGSAA